LVKIRLKGKEIREFQDNISILEICKTLGSKILKNACVGKINNKIVDLREKIVEDCDLEILDFTSEEGKKVYWHTTSHIMAQAVSRLFPDVKLAIGPAVDMGFYYDFDLKNNFSQEDLKKIEIEIKKIIKENLNIELFELEKDEALKLMQEKNQDYKIELIKKHAENGEKLKFYRQGEFIDLCAGPHLSSTGCIKAVRLINSTGAYWCGDSKNKMLQRIYGISFTKNSELEEYLLNLEKAKERDHNKIGRKLEYFTTVDYIGQGLPILLPNGAKVIQILQRFVEDEEEKRGYLLTKTPILAKKELYEISGHWQHYRDGMFVLNSEDENSEVLALRPMTCPFQFQVYLAKSRSYRDLPMRFNETATLFRNESSGEMHGLIRVRQFTLADGHIICTREQIDQEFSACIELIKFILETLGLENDVFYRLSKWDENNKEKYIGNAEDWINSQNKMREILDNLNIKYKEAEGEAAFYGPKLDVQIKNVYGKEDTLLTVQLDFQLAERFNIEYTSSNGQKKVPYIIHRSSMGCYERTLALLLEKYSGALPLWLMPEQVRILPISEKFFNYAQEIKNEFKKFNIRTEIDARNEKIGYKIREAQINKIPYMLIIGEKELENKNISVRRRVDGDIGSMEVQEILSKILKEINNKSIF